MSKTIFIASPLGFAASTDPFRLVLTENLQKLGYGVTDPWTLSGDYIQEMNEAEKITDSKKRVQAFHDISMGIAGRNAEYLGESNGVLAVLDGTDIDSGTASEIGYAYGLGNKVINGIRTDFRRSGENDGVTVNLQVQFWIEQSGGQIIYNIDSLSNLSF